MSPGGEQSVILAKAAPTPSGCTLPPVAGSMGPKSMPFSCSCLALLLPGVLPIFVCLGEQMWPRERKQVGLSWMLQMEAQGNLAFGCCGPCGPQEGLSHLKLPGSLVTRLARGGKLVGLQGTCGWIWFGTRVVLFFSILE